MFLKLTIFKLDVFWEMTPCILVKVYRRFRRSCCLQSNPFVCSQDGSCKILSTVGTLLLHHTASHPFTIIGATTSNFT